MKLDKAHIDVPDGDLKAVNLSALGLPDDLKAEWEDAQAQFEEGKGKMTRLLQRHI